MWGPISDYIVKNVGRYYNGVLYLIPISHNDGTQSDRNLAVVGDDQPADKFRLTFPNFLRLVQLYRAQTFPRLWGPRKRYRDNMNLYNSIVRVDKPFATV